MDGPLPMTGGMWPGPQVDPPKALDARVTKPASAGYRSN